MCGHTLNVNIISHHNGSVKHANLMYSSPPNMDSVPFFLLQHKATIIAHWVANISALSLVTWKPDYAQRKILISWGKAQSRFINKLVLHQQSLQPLLLHITENNIVAYVTLLLSHTEAPDSDAFKRNGKVVIKQ